MRNSLRINKGIGNDHRGNHGLLWPFRLSEISSQYSAAVLSVFHWLGSTGRYLSRKLLFNDSPFIQTNIKRLSILNISHPDPHF